MGVFSVSDGTSDPILTRMIAEDKVSWYRKSNLRVLYLYLCLCCMGVELASGFDSQLINTMPYSKAFCKNFGKESTYKPGEYLIEPRLLGLMNASYQLGSIFGVPIVPWVNHRFGRRWAIMMGALMVMAGAVVQYFSLEGMTLFIVSRAMVGFGIVFCIMSASAMIGELGYPKERAILTSLFNSCWYIGSVVAAAVSVGTSDIPNNNSWRILALLQLCPSLLQVVLIFLLPESPRWLISKDRDNEAFDILVKYHAEGDATSLLVRAEITQIRSTIRVEMQSSEQSWTDVVKTPGMRRRILICVMLGVFTQMSGNTFISYYSGQLFKMMGYEEADDTTRINLGFNCWGLINAVALALVVSRFKRRRVFILSVAGMLLAFTAMTISIERLVDTKKADVKVSNHPASIAALFFCMAYSPLYNMGNNALTYTYLVELFPYTQRTRGIGVEQVSARISGFVSMYLNPIAMYEVEWRLLDIYRALLCFELIFIFLFYPETQGRTLEELAFLFEDKALADHAVLAVEKQILFGDSPLAEEAILGQYDSGGPV